MGALWLVLFAWVIVVPAIVLGLSWVAATRRERREPVPAPAFPVFGMPTCSSRTRDSGELARTRRGCAGARRFARET